MKKVTKFGSEVLTGKALSLWLKFSDKTGEKVFCLQKQIKLSLALLYLADLFINKLKARFNNLFLQNYFKYKKNSQLLLKKFPTRTKQMPSKVLFVGKKKRRPRSFGHYAPKL